MSGGERSGRVLHVDDSPGILDVTALFLSRAGFEVATETDPRAALERVGDERFDCLITDVEMPGMNGVEFALGVRAQSPTVPVVVYAESRHDVAAAYRTGVDAAVRKTTAESLERLRETVVSVAEPSSAGEESVDAGETGTP